MLSFEEFIISRELFHEAEDPEEYKKMSEKELAEHHTHHSNLSDSSNLSKEEKIAHLNKREAVTEELRKRWDKLSDREIVKRARHYFNTYDCPRLERSGYVFSLNHKAPPTQAAFMTWVQEEKPDLLKKALHGGHGPYLATLGGIVGVGAASSIYHHYNKQKDRYGRESMLSFEEFVIACENHSINNEFKDENGNYKPTVEHETYLEQEKGKYPIKVKVTLKHTGNGRYEGSYNHPEDGHEVKVVSTPYNSLNGPGREEVHTHANGLTHTHLYTPKDGGVERLSYDSSNPHQYHLFTPDGKYKVYNQDPKTGQWHETGYAKEEKPGFWSKTLKDIKEHPWKFAGKAAVGVGIYKGVDLTAHYLAHKEQERKNQETKDR